MTWTVILEKGPSSWGAYVPDLPGVISVGDSRDEVEQLIREAINFHLQGMHEEGISIPGPSSFAGAVEVDHGAWPRERIAEAIELADDDSWILAACAPLNRRSRT